MWGELFKSSTATGLVHIPYRSAGPALNDVLAGEVSVYFDPVASSLAHVKAGKLKAPAVSWPERLAILPQVPTLAELGHAQVNEPSWFGLVAPAGTPAGAVTRLQQAVAQAVQEPAVRELLAAQGLYPSGSTPAEFSQQSGREIDKVKKVAATPRIELD